MKTVRMIFVLILMFLLLFVTTGAARAQAGPDDGQVPKLTADLLFSVTGAALAVIAYVIPPFRRFQARLGEWTPAYMAGSLFVVAVIYQLIWCQYVLLCLTANWQSLLLIWGTAFAANAGTYKALIKPAKKRAEAVEAERPSWVDEAEIPFEVDESN